MIFKKLIRPKSSFQILVEKFVSKSLTSPARRNPAPGSRPEAQRIAVPRLHRYKQDTKSTAGSRPDQEPAVILVFSSQVFSSHFFHHILRDPRRELKIPRAGQDDLVQLRPREEDDQTEVQPQHQQNQGGQAAVDI